MTGTDYDYDLRQIALMESRILQFGAGNLSRSRLIDDLDSLLSCLRIIDQNWKDLFKSEWWTLEQIHAVALDRKEASLPPDSQKLLAESLGNLRELILRAKDDLSRSKSMMCPE